MVEEDMTRYVYWLFETGKYVIPYITSHKNLISPFMVSHYPFSRITLAFPVKAYKILVAYKTWRGQFHL